ncbi:MAG: SBBP repeat-containing protein, partial [Terriglobia bacterium]
GKSNYFIGNDPKNWHTNVPNYAEVRYRNVYPGVDLVYYGNQGRLEYDFVVRPGANPGAVRLDVTPASSRHAAKARPEHGEGMAALRIAANGDLVMRLAGGEIRFHRPLVYQPAVAPSPLATGAEDSAATDVAAGLSRQDQNGGVKPPLHRRYLDGHYVLKAHNRVSFEVGSYDRRKALIIDPVLAYSSYLGGSGFDQANGIVVDGSGNTYLTGLTNSSDFPQVNQISGACNGTCGSGGKSVAFVTEINAAGNALVYSSLIGGSGGDNGTGIAVDGSGNAYLTGLTNSSDFPRVNQIPGICNGTCGSTGGFPDAFATKINASGRALVYSSYLGGSGPDTGYSIAVDGSGNAYLTGYTGSTDFPRVNQIPGTCAGLCGKGSPVINAVVTKINAMGSALVYSSLVGGSDQDIGRGIAVDGSGNVYLTGATDSPDFPRLNQIPGACNGSCGSAGGGGNAFVTKVNSAGGNLVYSSYVGGSNKDTGFGIAVDGSGDAYLTGATDSTDFPQVNQIPSACNGTCGSGAENDAFVAEISTAGTALVYSSYLGGSGADEGFGIAVDGSGNQYLTGPTNSTDFPQVNQISGACNGTCGTNGKGDAFVTKISSSGTPIVSLSPTSLTFGPQGVQVPNFPQTVTLTNTGQLPLSITSIAITGQNSGDFLQANNCPISPNTLGPGDNCTITVIFAPTGAGTLNADVSITDNAPGSPQNVPLTGVGVSGKPGLAGPQAARQTAKPGRH